MSNKEYVLKLLYIAFLEIRMAAYEQKNSTCFVLADIFHNVPLEINTSDGSEESYVEIRKEIQERCEARKCQAWLDVATTNIKNLH